jgi:hypothetical protein
LSTELKMVRYTARSEITLNEWTHVSVIRNSITGIIHVVIDNKVVDVFFVSAGAISPALAAVPAVPILIGKNNTTNYFNGLLDHIEIYSKALTLNQIYRNYHATIENNLILHLDFENIDEHYSVYDKSQTALVGEVLNPTEFIPITTPVVGEHTIDNKAFKSFLSQHIQFTTDETHIIQGNTLKNMTIMAWVKPESLEAYDPIISKKGVFSFVINELGVPELRLGSDGVDLNPLPIQSWMDMDNYTPDPRDYTGSLYRFDDPSDLVSINQKDKEGEGIELEVYGGASITTGKDSKSHGIRVNKDQYLQTTDTETLDLNAFTFGAWVKFDDTSKENQTILSMNGLQFTLNNGELSLIVA